MSTDPLVSVIIPVGNVAPYLPRCLDSVLAQTYTNLEIIVVDDGTTDGSAEIAAAYARRDSRVKVYHQPQSGVAAARNRGLQQVTAPYLTFVDADDYVSADYIATLYQTLQAADTPMAVVGICKIKLNGKRVLCATNEQSVVDPKTMLVAMLHDEYLAVYAKLYRTELWQGITFPVGRVYEDVAVMYQVVARCERIALHTVPLYYYCRRGDSLTARAFTPHYLDLITAVNAMCDFIVARYPDLQTLADSRRLWAYLIVLWQFALIKHPDPAIKKQLWQYVTTNRRAVLKSKLLPRRLAWTLRFTRLGFYPFRILRKIYYIVSGESKSVRY